MKLRGHRGTLRPIMQVSEIQVVQAVVVPNTYRDSVELMRLAAELEHRPGVRRAGLMMGTPASRTVLDEAGLLTAAVEGAGPNDLIVAVSGESSAVESALAHARTELEGGAALSTATQRDDDPPHTIAEALSGASDASLA